MEVPLYSLKTKFDDEFAKIDIYQKHPCLLPYIGDDYEDHRIMFIAESHWISVSQFEDITKNLGVDAAGLTEWWYENTDRDGLILRRDAIEYTHTRGVVESRKDSRDDKGRRNHHKFVLYNPLKIFAEYYLNEEAKPHQVFSDFLKYIAYMNYFQRPSWREGKSINNNEIDNKYAIETFTQVFKILKPKIVVFLSQKAINQYHESDKENKLLYECVYCDVYHPSNYWWNKDNGIYGRERLKKFFIEIKKN